MTMNFGNRNARSQFVKKDIDNPNIPMTFLMDDQRDDSLERKYWGDGCVREWAKTILKTESRELAYSMVRNGFEIINVTKGYTIVQEGDYCKEYKKYVPVEYTLWGVGRSLTSRNLDAIRDGVLWKIGFKKKKMVD